MFSPRPRPLKRSDRNRVATLPPIGRTLGVSPEAPLYNESKVVHQEKAKHDAEALIVRQIDVRLNAKSFAFETAPSTDAKPLATTPTASLAPRQLWYTHLQLFREQPPGASRALDCRYTSDQPSFPHHQFAATCRVGRLRSAEASTLYLLVRTPHELAPCRR